jgi:hypothetical protein
LEDSVECLRIHSKALSPFLKFARGDGWCDERWFSFFKMVGMKSTTPSKELAERARRGDDLDLT